MIHRIRTRLGDSLVRLGLHVMPKHEALQAATGDHLTRIAALYGCARETDEELRTRALDILRGIGWKP